MYLRSVPSRVHGHHCSGELSNSLSTWGSIDRHWWRLTDRVRKLHLISITADRQRLLFSPLDDQWSWLLDCRMSPHLVSQKWQSLAGFSTKGQCAVDKMHEIYMVFQSNAARIRGFQQITRSFSPGQLHNITPPTDKLAIWAADPTTSLQQWQALLKSLYACDSMCQALPLFLCVLKRLGQGWLLYLPKSIDGPFT